jgi:hypothetical protein
MDSYVDEGAQMGLLHADNVMRSLAEATGGVSFFPMFSGRYSGIYEAINRDLRHQYTLTYISGNTSDNGKFRKLRVEVRDIDLNADGKADKLKVRHKKEYYPTGSPR